MKNRIEGVMTPIVTPFTSDYKLDEEKLREEIGFLMDGGIRGLLVNGSTGECASLSVEERLRTIEIVKEECKVGAFIIAGVEVPGTVEAVKETERLKKSGVDAALVACPFYLKPTMDGVYEHYRRVAEVGFPVISYNNPFRTGVTLNTQMIEKLSKIKNIVGMKQSNVDMSQTAEVLDLLGDEFCFIHSYGEHVSLFPGLLLGGAGCFMMSTLFLPEKVLRMYDAVRKKDVETAKKIWHELMPMLKMFGGLRGEPNPAPAKEALRLAGRSAGPTRLPVMPVTEETSDMIGKALRSYKLVR